MPLTINQLSHLQTLELSCIFELQESLEFATSLTSLHLSFLSLIGGNYNESIETSQPTVQIPNMEWLVRLVKLEKLYLYRKCDIWPPIDLSSFSQL